MVGEGSRLLARSAPSVLRGVAEELWMRLSGFVTRLYQESSPFPAVTRVVERHSGCGYMRNSAVDGELARRDGIGRGY